MHAADSDAQKLFRSGVELFNQRQFFESHEAWEAVWNTEPEPERQFTQGLIQIAVGIYHWRNGNNIGALKLLPRGLKRIAPFQPERHGIDLSAFYNQAENLYQTLLSAPEAADEALIPQLTYL